MGPVVAKCLPEFGRLFDGLGLPWLDLLGLPCLGLAWLVSQLGLPCLGLIWLGLARPGLSLSLACLALAWPGLSAGLAIVASKNLPNSETYLAAKGPIWGQFKHLYRSLGAEFGGDS